MINKKDFQALAAQVELPYFNTDLHTLNDHVIRMSIMTHGYPWHLHPNSDETFIGVEDIVLIETPEGVIEIGPGTSVTIPANMPHRTGPKGTRSVNLTVEKLDMQTEFIDALNS
jgi:mannose-6-phosphate isomerase-like protein (cupin superfamily)